MKYQIQKGTKQFGANIIFEDIQFEIRDREKIAIVGRNGCGKTTLMKVISGEEHLDKGSISKMQNLRIGYLAQASFADEKMFLKDALQSAFSEVFVLEKQLNKITQQMESDYRQEVLDAYDKISHAYEMAGGYTYQQEIVTMLKTFQFEESDLLRTLETFSGGQKTRLAFIKMLLSKPDILLLDEPTNHLDIETIEWLEEYIKHYAKAVVLISHDRVFIDRVVDVVYEIEFHKMKRFPGNYTNYVHVKQQDLESQQRAFLQQQKEIVRLQSLIEKYRYKATKAAFAQSKIKYVDRMEKVDAPNVDTKHFEAHFKTRLKGGKRVLEIDQLQIGYERVLCEVSMEIMHGQRVAVIGPNGQGKSTLLKTIMNAVAPLKGSFLLGHQIEIGYFDQEFALFEKENTVIDEVWRDFQDLDLRDIRNALGCFQFCEDDVFKKVKSLSGGEKVRLAFAKLMLQQPNFMVLDEPTNHLDLIGKEALEKALETYQGSMLFVSHDRYFIDKMANAILVIENQKAAYYALSYQEYLQKKAGIDSYVEEKMEKKKQEKVRSVNYEKEIAKIEKEIDDLENRLEELRECRYDPDYYHDYKKMIDLDSAIDDVHNTIDHLMKQWSDFQEKIDEASK